MAKTAHPTGNLAPDLNTVLEALEVRYGRRKHVKPADFIESLTYQVLELGTSERVARDGLKRLRDEFADWNDMRVATVREIEDILGARFPKVRERSEDLKSLLADLWTAFRRMDLGQSLPPDGIETLRALPDTTNIRRDSVDRALAQMLDLRVFPTDDAQFRQLKQLGGVPKQWNREQGVKKIEETLDIETMMRLSRVLREHVLMWQEAGEEEPQIIAFGWDQADPLDMGKPDKKGAAKPAEAKMEKAEKPEKKSEKKPEAKKPEPKKAEEKKTDDKKTDDKKPIEKKPEAKKPEAKKPEAPKKPELKPLPKAPAVAAKAGKKK